MASHDPAPSPASGAAGARDDALCVAVVTGAHGVRGGLRVRLSDPSSEALREGLRVELHDGQRARTVTIARISRVPHGDRARMFVEEIDDRDEAESLRGHRVFVRRADLPALAADEFYLADTIGLRVHRRATGGGPSDLGVVVAISTNGAQDLLEVEWVSGTGARVRWLLPAIARFIREVTDDAIEVELPEGLLPESVEGSG